MPDNRHDDRADTLLRTFGDLSADDQDRVIRFAQLVKSSNLEPVAVGGETKPRNSLLGKFANLGIRLTAEDVADARKELWGTFPRPLPGAELRGS